MVVAAIFSKAPALAPRPTLTTANDDDDDDDLSAEKKDVKEEENNELGYESSVLE